MPKPPDLTPGARISARYAYVRVTLRGATEAGEPVEVIAGVELRPCVEVTRYYDEVRAVLEAALPRDALKLLPDDRLAALAEQAIRESFPMRSYFLEIGRGVGNQWVQVYEP